MAKSWTNHQIGKVKRLAVARRRKGNPNENLERWLQTVKTWHRRGQREGKKAAADKLVHAAERLDKRARDYGESGMHSHAQPLRDMAKDFRAAADFIVTGKDPS